jgi:hypothetical protein
MAKCKKNAYPPPPASPKHPKCPQRDGSFEDKIDVKSSF